MGSILTNRLRPWSSIGRRGTLVTWLSLDLLCINISAKSAESLANLDFGFVQWSVVIAMAGLQIIGFIRFGVYRSLVVYSGTHTLIAVCVSVALASIAAVFATYFSSLANTAGLGRVFLVLHGLGTTMLCGGLRMAARLALERRARGVGKRVLIAGSGSLAEVVMRQMLRDPAFDPIGFLDDNPARKGLLIHGRAVLGPLTDLKHLADVHRPDLLVIADPAPTPARLKAAFDACMGLSLQVKVAKDMVESLANVGATDLHDLTLEDLLRRPARSHDRGPVLDLLRGSTVLVTGAGGTIGGELSRQIAAQNSGKLILVDASEHSLFQIEAALRRDHPQLEIHAALVNLLDESLLSALIMRHRPSVVFHAAAYKHVPMVELNPFAGMANNLGGYSNLLSACISSRVDRLVTVSTDKAVKPTNVMGASKRACEVLMQHSQSGSTRVCAVRFGNVLGSSGSVVPSFLDQISRGGPVMVTHPEVTRYFMLVSEAVELVLQAAALAKDREIFILDMGSPVKIVNLARQLIFMTGHSPDRDIRIVFSGLRPGEKLYEELLLEGSERATTVGGITVARSTMRDSTEISGLVTALLQACRERDLASFIDNTQKLVPDWTPSDVFLDFIDGPTERHHVSMDDTSDPRRLDSTSARG